MIKLWQSEEPPDRPVGLTPEAILGLAGFAAKLGLFGMAAILLTGFDGFSRSGELFYLTVGSVQFMNGGAVVRLDSSKTLQISLIVNTLSESIVIGSRLAIKWLRRACEGRAPSDLLMGMQAATCRKNQADG